MGFGEFLSKAFGPTCQASVVNLFYDGAGLVRASRYLLHFSVMSVVAVCCHCWYDALTSARTHGCHLSPLVLIFAVG